MSIIHLTNPSKLPPVELSVPTPKGSDAPQESFQDHLRSSGESKPVPTNETKPESPSDDSHEDNLSDDQAETSFSQDQSSTTQTDTNERDPKGGEEEKAGDTSQKPSDNEEDSDVVEVSEEAQVVVEQTVVPNDLATAEVAVEAGPQELTGDDVELEEAKPEAKTVGQKESLNATAPVEIGADTSKDVTAENGTTVGVTSDAANASVNASDVTTEKVGGETVIEAVGEAVGKTGEQNSAQTGVEPEIDNQDQKQGQQGNNKNGSSELNEQSQRTQGSIESAEAAIGEGVASAGPVANGDSSQPTLRRESRTRVQRVVGGQNAAGNLGTAETPTSQVIEALENGVEREVVEALSAPSSDGEERQSQMQNGETTNDAKAVANVNSTTSRLNRPMLDRGARAEANNGPRLTEADQTRLVNRVAKAFEAAQRRDGEIRLRLSPPELGSIRLEVKVGGGVLSARVEAETPAARALLFENLDALRERLAEYNIEVENFDIDLMNRQTGGEDERFESQDGSTGDSESGQDGTANSTDEEEAGPITPDLTMPGGSDALNIVI